MTIKPVGSQKSVDGGKKDSHGHVQVVGGEAPNQNVVRSTHRNVVIDSHAQSPQRRGDVYEDIPRHRRSPHKSNGRSKREHHKREREREKISTTVQKCNSPHHAAFSSNLGNKSPGSNDCSPLASVSGQTPSPSAQVTANLLKAVEEAYSGYNSGDEHLRPKEGYISPDEWKLRDEQFDKMMSERGFILKNIEEDGACLFRAISLQIFGDEEMHDQIRQQTMDYIYQNREYFSHFVTEDINSYIKRKRKKDSHGNHIEIQAMSEIYNRPVELYCYKSTPINIFNSEQLNKGYPPLRLSYQRGSHYNAIIDPYNATVGVGLGLAGYKPELQTKEAVLLSEQLEIEQTMFEDKLKTTDWEATNEAIEEQIARESYLQWCRENMQKARMPATTATTNNSNHASGSSAALATTSATVTSAEASAAVASPSKYHQHQLRNSTCTVTNENLNSSTSSASSLGSPTTTASPSPPATTATTTAAAASMLNVGNMSPKSLTAFAQSLRKDSELCFDSDDTDMSSTSSIDHPSGEKLANRGKKSKNRGPNSRLSKRRRREMAGGSSGAQGDDKDNNDDEVTNQQKSTRYCDSDTLRSRPTTPDLDKPSNPPPQKANTAAPPKSTLTFAPTESASSTSASASSSPAPGTSKQVTNSNKNDANNIKTKSAANTPQSSSTSAPQAPAAAATSSPSSSLSPSPSPSSSAANQPPLSTFYQSLLESSYAADGFAQLSESEMLQQAIQLSTQEYLEDQKRKSGFLR